MLPATHRTVIAKELGECQKKDEQPQICTTLMAESEEEIKSLLTRMKESEKAGLKLNI